MQEARGMTQANPFSWGKLNNKQKSRGRGERMWKGTAS